VIPPVTLPGATVAAGPERRHHELAWSLALADGRRAALFQLVPELAGDQALRRRYVYEVERLGATAAPCLAPQLARGPAPDPRDPSAAPPWWLRLDPDGEDLEALLGRRAPLPVDEALALAAAIAEAVHGLHAAGLIARDLEPARIRLGDGGRIWLLDVGASRFGVLSSRTASSMLLESSPYAAPEHLRTTVVDPRADVYSLGVIAWRALTGELPFGDAHQILRGGGARASLAALRPGLPAGVVAAIEACLEVEVDRRPGGPDELAAVLRGERGFAGVALERVTCQACGEPLRVGLRLCLWCGREAVQLRHLDDRRAAVAVVLKVAREDEAFDAALRQLITEVGQPVEHELSFIVGDRRMYSKAEQARRVAPPVAVFTDLPRPTAIDLARRLKGKGLKVEVRRAHGRLGRRGSLALLWGGGLALGAAFTAGVLGAPVVAAGLVAGGIASLVVGARTQMTARIASKPPLAELRAAPAALPASDPLVARLAAVMASSLAPDLRERIAELALQVQRLVDHRAARRSVESELDLALAQIGELVELAAAEAASIAALDGELAGLDEGALVRALTARRARGEGAGAAGELHAGLDRLRALEDQRAVSMRRLLTAAELLRRAVEVAASTADPAAEEERLYLQARAELDGQG
jgi:hypothetical protein